MLYTVSISVQSWIRVRKHSGNIHSNITVQVYYYHCTWSNITRILHHHGYKKYDLQEIYTGQNW